MEALATPKATTTIFVGNGFTRNVEGTTSSNLQEVSPEARTLPKVRVKQLRDPNTQSIIFSRRYPVIRFEVMGSSKSNL